MASLYDLSPAKRSLLEATYDGPIPQAAIDDMEVQPEPASTAMERMEATLLMYESGLAMHVATANRLAAQGRPVDHHTTREIDWYARSVETVRGEIDQLRRLEAAVFQPAAE